MTLQQTRSADAATPRASGRWGELRPLLLRLHFYAGVLVAPFILIAAITGLAYTVAPQLESVVYHDQLTVRANDGTRLPLSEQVRAARGAHPDGDLLSVTPPVDATSSTRVVFADDAVARDYAKTVFVDPYDARVLGQVTSFGQWLGVRAWLDEMHRNLHLGAVGRNYSELAASWLWVVVLGGLALWLSRRRTRRRDAVVLERGSRGRRRALSWHGVVGTWIALGLLLLAASGLTWSRFAGDQIGDVRNSFDWSSRPLDTAVGGSQTPADGEHQHGQDGDPAGTDTHDELVRAGVGIDGVMRTARAEGLRAPMDLIPPTDSSSAWTAAENKRSAPTQYDSISVDPVSGAVVDRLDQGDWPFMAKMTDWVISAHMGILFGLINQVLLAVLAIGLVTVTVRAYQMWWRRRPARGGRRLGRPLPAGTFRSLRPTSRLLVVAVIVVAAWFVPLLGLSLAGFLLLDLVNTRRRGRAGGAGTPVLAQLPDG